MKHTPTYRKTRAAAQWPDEEPDNDALTLWEAEGRDARRIRDERREANERD